MRAGVSRPAAPGARLRVMRGLTLAERPPRRHHLRAALCACAPERLKGGARSTSRQHARRAGSRCSRARSAAACGSSPCWRRRRTRAWRPWRARCWPARPSCTPATRCATSRSPPSWTSLCSASPRRARAARQPSHPPAAHGLCCARPGAPAERGELGTLPRLRVPQCVAAAACLALRSAAAFDERGRPAHTACFAPLGVWLLRARLQTSWAVATVVCL